MQWIKNHMNAAGSSQETGPAVFATGHARRFTKISLCRARAVRQWHEYSFDTPLVFTHIAGHRRETACIPMLTPDTLKNTCRSVPLFLTGP